MKKPVYVDWAITNACNLNCHHCTGMSEEELTENEAKELANEIKGLSPEWVILEGGEPLLRDDIREIGAILNRETEVFVITNGNAFTRDKMEKLKLFSAKVIFSIDGASADVYESTKKGADFETVLEWAERCSEEGIFFGITTVLSKANLSQIEELIDLTEQLGGSSITFLPLKPFEGGETPSDYYREHSLSPEDHKLAVRSIYGCETDLSVFYDEPFLWNLLSDYGFSPDSDDSGITIPEVEGCAAGHSIYIQADGDVRPCMFSPEGMSFGNVEEESLEDIWRWMRRSEELKKWEDQTKREGPCADCSQFESCRGCLARTFMLRGDLAESDPGCPYGDSGA